MTVLLARSRQPPPTVAAGVPHAELAAELVSLPSGLLAMVCEAIVMLKVRLGAACACVRACVCACGRVCVFSCVRACVSPEFGLPVRVVSRGLHWHGQADASLSHSAPPGASEQSRLRARRSSVIRGAPTFRITHGTTSEP